MGSIPGQFPISLRAWPSKDDSAISLSSLISRIDSERNGFREVTEEVLGEGAQTDGAGVGTIKEDGGSELEDVETETDRVKELTKARGDILGQLELAHNAAMITLNFVSLLLSKDTPVQASLSISPMLRENMPLGTLGTDKVQDVRVSKSQKHDNRRIAKGWKLQSLMDTVNSILASATRLEKEIEKETKYWEQIITVSENGWAICRLPQERHTLGVRFGFAESALAFHTRSLGALRRNIDGSIYLDQGMADSIPKQVRIRIYTEEAITGHSAPFQPVHDPTSIGSSILLARNTIFEEELWQELNREARTLANQGVRAIGDEIVCVMTVNKRIVLDLKAIDDEQLQYSAEGLDDNTTAEMISLSLRLLLSYAHRQNYRRRSRQATVISSRPPPNSTYNLFRPVLARLHHEAVVSGLKNLLNPLSRALISAGVAESGYSTIVAQVTSAIHAQTQLSKNIPPLPERAANALINNLSAELTIPITQSPFPSQILTIRVHTPLNLDTRFEITFNGSLAKFCKPPPPPSTIDEVKGYILWTTACALAATFADPDKQLKNDYMDTNEADQDEHSTGIRGWRLTHNPTVLRKSFTNEKDSKQLSFEVVTVPGEEQGVDIRVMYRYINAGIEDEAKQRGSASPRVVPHVWKSRGAKDDITEQQSEDAKEHIKLRQYVEDAGRWSKSPGNEEPTFGDEYDGIEWDWT